LRVIGTREERIQGFKKRTFCSQRGKRNRQLSLTCQRKRQGEKTLNPKKASHEIHAWLSGGPSAPRQQDHLLPRKQPEKRKATPWRRIVLMEPWLGVRRSAVLPINREDKQTGIHGRRAGPPKEGTTYLDPSAPSTRHRAIQMSEVHSQRGGTGKKSRPRVAIITS